jgi:hypothetical protein
MCGICRLECEMCLHQRLEYRGIEEGGTVTVMMPRSSIFIVCGVVLEMA